MHNSNILYIDDDLTSVKVFQHVFSDRYILHTLDSTTGAKQILESNEIKVVLCDQQMPDDTGLDFFKRIRDEYPLISFVLITGHADMELAVETLNTGVVNRFITKPWDKNELELAIVNGIESYNLKQENKHLLDSLKAKNADLELYTEQLIKTTNALTDSNNEIKARDNALKEIVSNSYLMGERYFFKNMVLSLNKVLHADFTFIATLIHNNKIKTLACCKNNQAIDNIECPVETSPHELVVGAQSYIIKNNAAKKFPGDTLMVQEGIEGYIGTPIFSLSGIPIGILVSLFKTPISDATFGQSLFELFSTNIGAEIERRSIVKDLKDSKKQLNNIFSSINDSIFVHPLNAKGLGNFIEVNQAACDRYGYSKAELLKMSPVDIVWSKHDMKLSPDRFNRRITEAGKLTFETVHVTKEGERFPVEVSSNAVAYNGGLMVWAVVRDISDRIRTENELEESEAKFKQFFNRSTDAIFVADVSSGIIIDANETACDKTGYKYEEIIGLHQSALHPEQFVAKSRELFKNHVEAILRGGKVSTMDSLLLTKRGDVIPVEVTANLVSIKGKAHILGIFRDVSLRKKAERGLIESENKYKTTFLTSPDAVMLTNSKGELLDVNDVFLDYSGYSRDEVIGKSLVELKLWKNDSNRIEFLEQIKANGTVKNFESIFKSKYDDDLIALVSANSFKMNGEPHNITVAREISERKRMEQELLENEQLLNKVFESAPYIVALLNANREVVKINLDNSDNNTVKTLRRIGAVLKCIAFCNKNNETFNYKYCVGCCIADQFQYTFETGNSMVKKEVKIQTLEDNQVALRYYLISTSLIKRKLKKYVLLTIDDVTEQKNTENELIKSIEKAEYNEKRYSLLSDLTFEGIVLHDKTNIIDVNKALKKLSGYNKSELIGANILDKLFEKKYHGFIKKKINNKYTPPYETYLKRKDGHVVPVEIEAHDFKLKDKALRVAAIRDITERTESEKRVLQAILNTEEKQKTKFAQELHDGLGPLLSNVQMYFQWLSDEDENKEFVLEKGLASLKNAFRSLREISNNLSPHVLHDFGLTKALKHFVNGMPQIETQVLSVNSKIKDKRYEIEIEVALYRIITELINNSKKYAEAKNIIINLDEVNNQIYLKYLDDGKGFNFDDEKVFNTGKGLLNIKNRVKTLNGSFDLKTNPGAGLEVAIKVPIIMN